MAAIHIIDETINRINNANKFLAAGESLMLKKAAEDLERFKSEFATELEQAFLEQINRRKYYRDFDGAALVSKQIGHVGHIGLVARFAYPTPLQVAQRDALVLATPGQLSVAALSLSEKVLLIDFWASWCIPCKHSFPWLNEMQQRYAEDGLKIIAINIDEDQADAREFLERVPASFAIAYDPEGDVADLYRLKVMPSSYLIDRNGNMVHTHKGFKTSDGTRMEEKIRKLLQQDQVK